MTILLQLLLSLNLCLGVVFFSVKLYAEWEGMTDLIRWQRAVIEKCYPKEPEGTNPVWRKLREQRRG